AVDGEGPLTVEPSVTGYDLYTQRGERFGRVMRLDRRDRPLDRLHGRRQISRALRGLEPVSISAAGRVDLGGDVQQRLAARASGPQAVPAQPIALDQQRAGTEPAGGTCGREPSASGTDHH